MELIPSSEAVSDEIDVEETIGRYVDEADATTKENFARGVAKAQGKDRLKAMAQTNDGFEIARRDLEIRGPGEFMGARQSGDALLRFADLATDSELLQQARNLAPKLLRDHPAAAQAHVARWLDSRADYLKA